MDFPRLVYKSAATHKLVANADEHAEALKDGWFASVPEAEGKPTPVRTVEQAQIDYDKTAVEIVAGKYTIDYAAPQMAAHYKIAEELVRQELTARVTVLSATTKPLSKKEQKAAEKAAAQSGVAKAPWD